MKTISSLSHPFSLFEWKRRKLAKEIKEMWRRLKMIRAINIFIFVISNNVVFIFFFFFASLVDDDDN
jgi:hypothetical protein